MGRKNVTKSDLARKTDISRSKIGYIINGEHTPYLWQVRQLAQALGLDSAKLQDAAERIARGTADMSDPDPVAPLMAEEAKGA